MIKHWTIFEGRPNTRDRSTLRVTLNKKGIFLLNLATYSAMGRPAAVEFRFDEKTRTIGLAPKDPRAENAFPMKGILTMARKKASEKYTYMVVNAAPFCRHFDIRPVGTVQFGGIDMDNDGTLLLELNKAVSVGRGSR